MARIPEPRTVVVYGHGYQHYDHELDVLAGYGVKDLEAVPEADAERAEAVLRDADALLVREAAVRAPLVDALRRCRVIVRYGIGVDNIDLAAAASRRIYVANVPAYGVDEVSTHALALYLAVARRIVSRDRDVRRGVWGVGAREPVRRITGSTLGLVGFGRIGEALHNKARGLGFRRTLAFDPYRTAFPEGVEPAPLETVLGQAHLVSIHAPLTPETHHLLDAERLALMRPDAILVNTGRGGLVDEGALIRALDAEALLGAGIDVFETEPPDPADPLLAHPKVVLSDHTAWYSDAAQADLQRGAAEEIARVFGGKAPRAWVNPWDA